MFACLPRSSIQRVRRLAYQLCPSNAYICIHSTSYTLHGPCVLVCVCMLGNTCKRCVNTRQARTRVIAPERAPFHTLLSLNNRRFRGSHSRRGCSPLAPMLPMTQVNATRGRTSGMALLDAGTPLSAFVHFSPDAWFIKHLVAPRPDLLALAHASWSLLRRTFHCTA